MAMATRPDLGHAEVIDQEVAAYTPRRGFQPAFDLDLSPTSKGDGDAEQTATPAPSMPSGGRFSCGRTRVPPGYFFSIDNPTPAPIATAIRSMTM